MIKAAVIGGSGYTGGELIRLLLFHPGVDLISVTSRSHTGEKISDVHRNLFNICNLEFQKEDIERLSQEADILFFALPHMESMKKIQRVDFKKTKVIDLSTDFRLKSQSLFQEVYGIKHSIPKLLPKVVYGLTEWHKMKLENANMVANPGCFPTGALLALLPLAKAKLLSGNVVIDSKTGSSGSGTKPSEKTHHPERAHDVTAYNIFNHRHFWEIAQELSNFLPVKKNKIINNVDFIFTPHSVPIVRGLFTTVYVFLKNTINESEVKKIYETAYQDKPFIRLVESAHCAVVAGTNYCDISVHAKGNKIIITSAIDNLVKGAAGQAVQNMNIMFGLNETTGLSFPGTHP